MLEVLRAEDSPLCLGGSSTCVGFPAMPDGNFVLSKAHTRLHVKSKTANTIVLDSIVFGTQIHGGVEGKQKYSNRLELVVFGQKEAHKIGLSYFKVLSFPDPIPIFR